MDYARHETPPSSGEVTRAANGSATRDSHGLQRALGMVHMGIRFGLAIVAGLPTTVLVPLPLTLALTRRFRDEDRLRRLHSMAPWARFVRKHILGIELSVAGRDNLPRPSRGYLYISNHQSYVDISVLMDALDTVAFLSKRAILYIPLIGLAAYAGGTVFFARRDKRARNRALQETLRMCKSSTAVLVFPEGTRSPDGRVLGQIRPGAIAAAWEQGLSVLPVGLDGTLDVVPKSMDRVNLGRRVAVSIGAPLRPRDFADKAAFVRAAWEAVRELHQASRARISRPKHDPRSLS